jgi:cytoskeleton protein RodZ
MSEPTPDPASAGALIRAAREKQGLHIAALAAAIKVSPRKLDALENDRWHELPDATFSRALAQTVCRTLKIDPRPILERLPAADTASLEQVAGTLNEPFQDRPGRIEPGLTGGAIRPMVIASGLLMVAAAVVYFLPQGLFTAADPASAPASAAASVAVPMVVAPAADPASAPTLADPAASAAAALPGAATAASEPLIETVFSAPPVAAVAASAAAGPAAPALAPPAGLVLLRSGEASWVEARDARGEVLLSRTVLPGESVGLNGTLPIKLVIGNASGTELAFRGKPVDLLPLTRDNVARVELR